MNDTIDDEAAMRLAMREADAARARTSPNPWVGAVVVADGRVVGAGATQQPGGHHAEVLALAAAGPTACGATLAVTLEPCAHTGRTPPCVERIIAAGISRVVVGIGDPDPLVDGAGIAALRRAGIAVRTDVLATEVAEQLRPYCHHRRTGRPYVVCKLAASVDGGTAAADGSSRWITGPHARADVHRLRAESDAVVVGAGTVRADDPELTVRHVAGPDPLRVVVGSAPTEARIRPCLEWNGPLTDLLDELGSRGVLQLLVEGGPTLARSFHDEDLVDRFVVYVAPALLGSGARPLLAGPGAATIDDAWRGTFGDIARVGEDLRVELIPPTRRSR